MNLKFSWPFILIKFPSIIRFKSIPTLQNFLCTRWLQNFINSVTYRQSLPCFYKPTTSLTKRVKCSVESTTTNQVKKYVQASKFYSYQLLASQIEHMVILPSDLPYHCLAQGYTYIQFGAILLELTFHGRKGLPTYSQISLVDTRFVEYERACIGIIQTTLQC